MTRLSRRKQRCTPPAPRKATFEQLESRVVLATSPLHNLLDPFDVFPVAQDKTAGFENLATFVAANDGLPSLVPAAPQPEATTFRYFDVDNSGLIDRFDVSDVVRHLAATRQPATVDAPGTASLATLFAEGEGPYGPPGPGGPPSVGVSAQLMPIIENAPAANIFTFTRTTTIGGLTVNFTLSGTASTSDWQSPVLASGMVTFASGQSTVTVSVAGVEDTLLEIMETLIVTITPSSAYQIGQSNATGQIHDGEHGIIDTGFSLAWQESPNVWRGVDANEVLWNGYNYRWAPNIPPSLVGHVQSIQFYKRPFGSPGALWEAFAGGSFNSQSTKYFVYGFPGIGHYDIMYRVSYGALSWFQAAQKIRDTNGIAQTFWTRGYAEQRFEEGAFPDGFTVRVFPERQEPFSFHADQSKVKFNVQLHKQIAPNFLGEVKVRVMDPDHSHDPGPGDDSSFDPNDHFWIGEDENVAIFSDDNRISGATPSLGLGGSLSETVLTFAPGDQTKSTPFSIDAPQPGNNFVGVAYEKLRHESFNKTETVIFDTDGTSLIHILYPQVPAAHRTKLMTVWRTLWVERDSMNTPLDPDHGPFNATDPNPGDLGNVPIDLLAANFLPAQIEVSFIEEGFALPADDIKDDRFFYHYIEDAPALPTPGAKPGSAPAADVRDVPNGADLWVIHLINGYEGGRDDDFDDEEFNSLGQSIAGTNTAYVFSETIRDRAAFVSDPDDDDDPQTTVDQARLLNRTVLHESGHLMGAIHGTELLDGIMDPDNSKIWQDNSKAVYTIKHFAIFQWKSQPGFP